ncbi:MAG: sodium:solute symporter family protein, partial [Cytophagales bacterium]
MKTILYLFAAFVIVNLVVGLYYSRGVKTFKGYAVGDGNMHPWLLAATIAATWITGSGFASYLTRGFNDGLYQMGVPIFASFSLLLLGFFALRMGEFLGTTSVASAMERLYGKRVMWLTAIAAIICCVFHLAGQLRVFSNVVANVLGLDPTTMLLTLSTLVVLYSIFGGIRAVVFTDLLQFGMMGLGLPVLIYLIYGYLGEQVFTISYVPDNKTFVTNNVLKGPRGLFLQTIGYMRKLLIVFMPPLFQRCLVNRDLLKTRKAFRRATLAWVYISILVMLLGRMLATDPIGLDRKNLLESIVGKYPYVGLKTALAFVIMAMALSSADSNINSSAVLLCDLTQHKSLSHVRGFGVLTGLISLAMVFFTQEKSLLQVVYLGDFLYSAIVVPVLILALLGFRSSNRVALISMIGSALVALGCKLIYTDSLIGIVLGALTNVVLMFALHYGLGEFGGWVGIKDRIPLIAHRQLCQRKWARRWAATRSFDLGRYLQSNLPKKEGHYIFFGLYVMTFVFGGAFFLPREVMQDGRLIWLLGSFLFLNSLMMTYPIWPEEIKGRRAIAPLWAFGVGYILFYIGGLLLLLGGFHPAHMMLFAANLTLGMLLLRRKLLGLWMVVGGVMAVVTCRGMGHEIGFSDVETTWAQLLFSLLVTLAGFWAIYANKQRHRKLARKHVSLDSLQQSTEDALVALRMAPEHFAQKLVETQHAGVESAYQMSKERLGEANELTKKIDWSAQYLAKTLHMIQQQTQVRPVTTSLITFLQDLYTQHPALNEAGLILYNHAR